MMATFTKKDIMDIKKGTDNKLTKKVINVLLDKGNTSDIECYINDLLQHGCQSGIEGTLIYYTDTMSFYKKYQKEIKLMLKEMMDDTGAKSPKDLFGDKWEDEDMFAEEQLNQNLLAWFGFEESVRKIAYDLEMDI
jgi:hypothetical protein